MRAIGSGGEQVAAKCIPERLPVSGGLDRKTGAARWIIC